MSVSLRNIASNKKIRNQNTTRNTIEYFSLLLFSKQIKVLRAFEDNPRRKISDATKVGCKKQGWKNRSPARQVTYMADLTCTAVHLTAKSETGDLSNLQTGGLPNMQTGVLSNLYADDAGDLLIYKQMRQVTCSADQNCCR